MSEYQKLRVTENYRLLAILPSACAQTPRTVNRIFRPILVRLRGKHSQRRMPIEDAFGVMQL